MGKHFWKIRTLKIDEKYISKTCLTRDDLKILVKFLVQRVEEKRELKEGKGMRLE